MERDGVPFLFVSNADAPLGESFWSSAESGLVGCDILFFAGLPTPIEVCGL